MPWKYIIDARMHSSYSSNTGTPEAIERNSEMNPMGVVGEGEDSAALIDLLLSDQARWITAQQIGVDGGQAVIHPLPKG